MTRPLPGLRRLYALGGAARRTAERLGEAEERRLARLEPALDRLDLVCGESIEPLLAPSDGSAAIARILERLSVPSGVLPNTAPAPQAEGEEGEVPILVPELPRGRSERRQGGSRAAARALPPAPAEPGRVAEILNLYASGERGAEGMVSPRQKSRGKDTRDTRDARDIKDVESTEAPVSVVSSRSLESSGSVRSLGSSGAPVTTPAPLGSGGKELRARAIRAGAGNAADAPVGTGLPNPRIARLLERLALPGRAPEASLESAAPVSGRSGPEPVPVREPSPRIAAGEPEAASGGAAELEAPPVRRIRPAPRPLGSGLRALASLAGRGPAEPEAVPRPEPEEAAASRPVEPAAPFPDGAFSPLAAEGTDAADLAERLDRLLRREVRRHGIEVDEP